MIDFGSKNSLERRTLGDRSYVNVLLKPSAQETEVSFSTNKRSSVTRTGRLRRRLGRRLSYVIKRVLSRIPKMGDSRKEQILVGPRNNSYINKNTSVVERGMPGIRLACENMNATRPLPKQGSKSSCLLVSKKTNVVERGRLGIGLAYRHLNVMKLLLR
jgi:hypothetical protein